MEKLNRPVTGIAKEEIKGRADLSNTSILDLSRLNSILSKPSILGFLIIIPILFFSSASVSGQCTQPAPASECETAGISWNHNVTVNGTSTWNSLGIGSADNVTQKIRIGGSGTVIVQGDDLLLKSSGAILFIDGPTLVLDNGNLKLDNAGSRYIQHGGALQTYGNFQQVPNTVICIIGTNIEIGEEMAGTDFTTQDFTSANWQNDGGYRYLKENCINVTHDFQLQSTGSGTGLSGRDVIISCCFEIGDAGENHATPTEIGDKDGDDSGNWQNSNRQEIFDTDIVVANGDFQTSIGIMTLCDVDVKLNKSGNFQVNSGTLNGQNVCVAIYDEFENSGTWTASVTAWYSKKENSTNVPGAGPESDLDDILATCFANNCCEVLNCIPVTEPGSIAFDEDNCEPFDPAEIVNVTSAEGDSNCGSEEDCCVSGFKPAVLTMYYTGEGCGATQTTQGTDKWNCDGDPGFDNSVYIIANDDDDPTDGNIWFTGIVNLNSTFLVDAANAGEDKLKSNTVIHIYDSPGGSLIQKVNFHTSCSQPLAAGDQWGAAQLLHIVAENGDTCGNPSGAPGNVAYQWQSRTGTSGSWTDIDGATGENYDPPFISETMQYRRLALNCLCGDDVSSNIVTKSLLPPASVDAGPDQVICEGESVTITAVSTAGLPNFTFSWDNGLGAGASHTVSPVVTTTYTVTMVDGNGCEVTDQVTITVTQPLDEGGEIGADESHCGPYTPQLIYSISEPEGSFCGTYEFTGEDCCDDGDKPISMVLLYNGESCAESLNNQGDLGDKWDCSGDAGGDSNVYIDVADDHFSGYVAINTTFTVYDGGSNLSNPIEISIYDTEGGTLLQYIEIHTSCSAPIVNGDQFGSLVLLSTEFNDGFNCGAEVQSATYQWQSRTGTSGPWADIDGATGPEYAPSFITETTQYRRVASNCGCGEEYSNIVTKTVTSIDPGEIEDDESYCGPFDPAEIVNVISASDGEPSLITGESCCESGFKPAVLTMRYTGQNCSATVTTQPDDKWNCDGDPGFDNSVYIIANDDDDPTDGNIWFTGTVALNDNFVVDAANAGEDKLKSNTVIHIFDVQGGTLIQKVNFHTSCSQPLATGDQWGAALLLHIVAENGNTCVSQECELTYQWQSRLGTSGTFVDIPGATEENYDPPFITETTQYQRLAISCTCGTEASNIVTKEVTDGPDVNITVNSDETCVGNDGNLTANPSGGTPPYFYQWDDVNNSTSQTISGLPAGTYNVTVTDSEGCEAEASGVINPRCFDLALQKVVATTGPFLQGDAITYSITIINQGTVPASNVEVTDYVPDGLQLNDGAWNQNGNLATRTIAGPIAANGGTATVTISFTIDNDFFEECIINCAEISDAENDYGLTDWDSNFDQNKTNDPGGQPESPADDYIDGDGTGTPGDGVAATDEDDQDPAKIYLPIVTHTKTITNVAINADGVTYDATYEIVVTNSGQVVGQYDLDDQPAYDGDLSINSASYSSDAPGNAGNALAGTGLWELAEDQSIGAGDVHTYTLTVNVSLQMTDGQSDDLYSACGSTTGTPQAGEGLFNESFLDLNNDGDPEEIKWACGDLPNKIGDYVWEDRDRDGIQDPDESGVPDVTVNLKNANNQVIQTTTTGPNGEYCFVNLDPGDYSVQFIVPYEYRFTVRDVPGDDCLDSDADATTDGMTHVVTVEETTIDLKIDGGIYLRPFPGIADPCGCLDNSTTLIDGQFEEEIAVSHAYEGDTWYIIAQTGMYLDSSPAPPAAPIPVPLGTVLVEVDTANNDLSTYIYHFIHIEEGGYSVTVTNGFDTLSISNVCYYPEFIELNIPNDPICINDDPIPLSGVPDVEGTVNFYLNGELVTEIDPAELGVGTFQLTAEIIPDDPEECIATLITQIVSISDGCIFDLALDKSVVGNGPFVPGGIVEYQISVTNEGTIDATSVEVTDYIPDGMSYVGGGWTVNGNVATRTLPGLAVGETTNLSIILMIDNDYQGTMLLNCAEISDDANEDDQPDEDSTPDQNPNNDPEGEDDFDCEPITVEHTFDLALDKSLLSNGPFVPGSIVEYEISVTNEGTLDATDVEVTDYIPTGMSYVGGGWTVNGSLATRTIASLDAGETVDLSIVLQIDDDYQGTMLVNCAEISEDDNALDEPDVDSTPDQNPNNDPENEDDFDCEPITVEQTFDLALDKSLLSNGPFVPGSIVEYEISVTNEGTLDATSVEVTDYIPSGMSYVGGGWTVVGNIATRTIASLAVGETVDLSIVLQIDDDYQGTMLVNCAEISEDDNALDEPDTDSTPDQNPNNDPEDEDDFDCEPITVEQTFDLALDKSLLSNGPFVPGSIVEYEISVTNEGTLDATSVEVIDYIPSGMSYVGGGWTVNGNLATQTIAAIASGATVTLNIILEIDDDYQGTMLVNCAEISEDDNALDEPDVDSTPDQNPNNDPEDEDDFDCEPITVEQTFDLALNKERITIGPFQPGSVVEYEISVTNEGTLDATNVEVTDYIPDGMSYVGGGWTVNGSIATQNIGSLAVGATTTLSITLMVDDDFQGTTLINCAEISEDDNALDEPDVDSTPDQNPNNDPDDEDDFDCAPLNIGQTFDLALDKSLLSNGPFVPGSTVNYEISVTNQGTLTATDIEVTDYIPDGLNYVGGGWTVNGNIATQNIASLASGATTTLNITFMIDEDYQGTMLVNCAEISEDDNALGLPDEDSTPDQNPGNDPPGEDDFDCEPITVEQTFDLALDKSLLSNGPFIPGSTVNYEISVTNEGTLDATDVEVTDYIPDGMSYVGGGWTVNGSFATQIIPVLAVGQTATLNITLMIDVDYQGTLLTNCAEISDDDNAQGQQDVDSNPDQNAINDLPGEDDFDCVPITVEQTFDLALDKMLIGNGPFFPGSFVQFDISVTNEGTLDATNVEVTDYIPDGMSYFGGGWTVNGNFATQTIGFIPVGQTVTLSITFQIDEDFQGNEMLNCAEISEDDNELDEPDTDSTPDQNPNNDPEDEDDFDCEPVTVEQTFDLALDKSLIGSGPFEPGSSVQFEISVTNEGTLDATNVEVTDYIPDGLNYTGGGWSVNGNVATQTIPFVGVGETVSLTISFVIDDDFQGSTMINCAEISEDDNAFDEPDQDSTPDQNPNNDPPGEDDYDCEQITIGQSFDLSLDKSLIGDGPFFPGSFVQFDISVTNEGSLDATDVEVTDYIPNGMNYFDGGWTVNGGVATQDIPFIGVGETVTLSITFQIDEDYQGDMILNCAEISEDGNAADLPDQDSTPDQNPNNDPPGEDDYDCEPVVVEQTFDLALDKSLIGEGPFFPGSFVQFDISVTNEGSLDATDVEVTDYIPNGMNYFDGGWTVNGGVATQLIPFIGAGETVTLSITFQIDEDYQGNMMLNCAEISEDNNEFDEPDQDSTPDQNPNNDPEDEDDFDCEPVTIGQTFDLALDKDLIGNGPFFPGSFVQFDISVTNEGSLDATDVEVTDYIPNGMNYFDGGWTVNGGVATQVIPFIGAGETVTLSITFQIDEDYQGNMMLNCAEISEDNNEFDEPDQDSTPDQNPNNDPEDEDDFDCEPVTIGQTFDLALDKDLIGNGPFFPGSFVQFAISVTNEGSLDATDVEVTDYIPNGMNYFDGGWTVNGGVATQVIPFIGAGETVTLSITFQIDEDYQGNMMLNCAEISEDNNEFDAPDQDSTPDQNPNNDPEDEDDFDCEPVPIGQTFDLSLDKDLIGNGPFFPGSFVQFDISVTNEGSLDATDVEVTDYIPNGMNYFDGGWTVNGGVASQVIPFIGAGETVTLNITFQIDEDYQGNMMLNCAEISEDNNEFDEPDQDSTPDQNPNNDPEDEDDFDCEPVPIGQTFDLSLDKELIGEGPFSPGDIIQFEISVTNEGTLDATDVEVTDYIPNGMNYFDGGWNINGNIATQTIPFIGVGETVTLSIAFQIDEDYQGNMMLNCAEISNAENDSDLPDVDSTPDQDPTNDPDGEDDFDCEPVELELIFDLSLIKILISEGPFSPGDLVTYAIQVTNEGDIDAYDVEVTDHIPEGMTYDSGNWTVNGNDATQVIPEVLVGQTVTLFITLQIDPDFTGGTLINEAEITEDNDDDVDSDPETGDDTDEDGDGDGDDDDEDEVPIDLEDDCVLVVEIIDVICNDNGTFSAVLNIDGTEGGSWFATVNGQLVNVGNFPATTTFGPFTTATEVTITQVGDETCTETILIDDPFDCGEIIIECPLSTHFCPIIEENIMLFTTDPFVCTGTVLIPLPEVTANGTSCSAGGVVTWTLVTEIWTLDGNTLVATLLAGDDRVLNEIPVGDYIVRYVATDNCGDDHIQDCFFRVVDLDNPVAVCFPELNVSLGGFGLARLYNFQVDNSSYDNCEVASVELRREYILDPMTCDSLEVTEYSDWGNYVEFNCCDAGMYITVEMKVTDIYGNENICISTILIEDNTLPLCYGLEDVTVNCDDLPDGFDPYDPIQLSEVFGMPIVIDNCSVETIEYETEYDLADCGYGTIIRRFQAVDAVGNLSVGVYEQVVTIDYTLGYEIKLPADTETDCIDNANTVELFHVNCDALEVTYVDEFLEVQGDECYNVLRTYHIINHCEWDGLAAPVHISRDEDCDGVEGEEDVWVLRTAGSAFVDRDDNHNNSVPAANTKGTGCDGTTNSEGYWRTVEPTGYWTYTQHVIIYDNTPAVIVYDELAPVCTDSVECEAPIEYPFSVLENCIADDLVITVWLDIDADGLVDVDITELGALEGSYPNYVITGTYPIGAHSFIVIINDGCGNSAMSSLPFEIVDCYIPEIVCYIQYEVALEEVEPGVDVDGDGIADEGAVEVFAWQLASCDVEDCSGPLRFSVNEKDQVPNPDSESIILTCEDKYGLYVDVYMWDNAFNPYAVQPDGSVGGPNYDYCEVLILVDDPLGLCPDCEEGFELQGRIATENNKEIQNADVALTIAVTDNFVEDDLTDEVGVYNFLDVAGGENYVLTPSKDGDDLNGVSTMDLINIYKHILGVYTIDSPYKLLAADVNNSGTITVSDVIEIRKLILGNILEFSESPSWVFVDKGYVFPEPGYPWLEDLPNTILIENLQDCMTDLDFVGIKMGDVNLSAVTIDQLAGEFRNETGAFNFKVMDRSVAKGETFSVTFTAPELKEILGYQFTLDFDKEKIEFVSLEEGIARSSNFGLNRLDRGLITSSWHDTGELVKGMPEMFTITFVAKQSMSSIDEVFVINSAFTAAEAYGRNGEDLSIGIQFYNDSETIVTAENRNKLYQNTPNPFSQSTRIGFDLVENVEAKLVIRDVSGKIVQTFTGFYDAGYNELVLKSGSLTPGVYYYTLSTDGFTATKKMIVN